MNITTGKTFDKALNKLSPKQQSKTQQRLNQWLINPRIPSLCDHALRGKWKGYRSINVGGDLRVIYRYVSPQEILLATVGTHSQLYE